MLMDSTATNDPQNILASTFSGQLDLVVRAAKLLI
jgi:hypothetical protein